MMRTQFETTKAVVRLHFSSAVRLFMTTVLVIFGAAAAQAMSVVAPTFHQLVGQAEQIARVEVTSIHAQWDVTPTGQRVIHTYVTCDVRSVLKGDATSRLELRFLGGDVGHAHMVIADMPQFQVGGEYILFLAQNGRAFCPLVSVMYGSYRVTRDGATGIAYVSRHDGEPLRTLADVEKPMIRTANAPLAGAITADAFCQSIAAEQQMIRTAHGN